LGIHASLFRQSAAVAKDLASVPAEAAGGEVEHHFEEGDLAQVEIGGDDLSIEARFPFERDLLHEIAGEVLDELELFLFVDLPLSLALSREGRG
jgi:hypothetical protein